MKPDFKIIAQQFAFEGQLKSVTPHGNGHINDTFAGVFNLNGDSRRYILQRINHQVFKEPIGLMENISAVTTHLSEKIITAGGDPKRETLSLVQTNDGGDYYLTDDGNYWRAYIFIENATTYEEVENLDHVYNAAWAFGNFQNQLSDFPADKLNMTIPNFHNTPNRFNNFQQAVDDDVQNLANSSKEEIRFIQDRGGVASILVDMMEQGDLLERVTHNDTKFNNVMMDDETGLGVCIIDLDTVMPGLSLYDFGDSIRSMTNTAPEDERDLSKVHFDIEIYEQYTRGYLDAAGEFLTPLEIEYLPTSAMLMTLECGIRFLTDHLQGDIYYKTHRENHNLDRCRTQFKLVEEMEKQLDHMVSIVEKYGPS